jgi:hypothetical protein
MQTAKGLASNADSTKDAVASAADLRRASRYVPPNSTAIEHPLATCYVHDTARGFAAIGYVGNAGKRAFYESFRTAEQRDKRVADFFAGLEATKAMRAGFKAEREKPHTIKVGDIIHHSWGWEQTQCDFYQVLEVTAHGATIQAITAQSLEGSDGFMSDRRLPVRDDFHGEPLKVRISGHNYVTTLPHGSAGLWDGQAKYCSWYG